MTSDLLYFDIDHFKAGLSFYLKTHTAWHVTAMCPVTYHEAFTDGIFVTVERRD